MPERHLRSALNQSMRRSPLCKSDCIVQRRASGDHGTGRLDIGAGIKKSVKDFDIIAACRPMKRRLGVRPGEPSVHIRAGLDEDGYGLRTAREVTGPVCRYMQQRARRFAAFTLVTSVSADYSCRSQPRIFSKKPFQ
ncbi:hypothetical protein PACILC2_24250 [Paenibacillus cisolokensis]|uniref:Uncharacterized protein n=1 Tax=Paenibacillus cisolokensis TaxID=1658519 RepID=A0ABQ4N6M9_9BACL|nr:hypothetical protein PACILC2_24250 [Paenibacillus cisolokensis]